GIAGSRHAAQRCGDREGATAGEEGAFVGTGLALEQRKRKVAADQRAAFARQPVAKAGGDRADAGDRHHPERDAGDEHGEPAQTPAQVAQREAGGKRQASDHGRATAAPPPAWAGASAASIWPERSRTTRS